MTALQIISVSLPDCPRKHSVYVPVISISFFFVETFDKSTLLTANGLVY